MAHRHAALANGLVLGGVLCNASIAATFPDGTQSITNFASVPAPATQKR